MDLIATHDQAMAAIDARISAPGVDPLLRSVTCAVLLVHVTSPSPTGRPDLDCPDCEGQGTWAGPDGQRLHCHCRCPWCSGCSEPVCGGPCETVAAVGAALGIPGLAVDVDRPPFTPPLGCRLCGAEERGHCSRWQAGIGYHTWSEPTREQIAERMRANRGLPARAASSDPMNKEGERP